LPYLNELVKQLKDSLQIQKASPSIFQNGTRALEELVRPTFSPVWARSRGANEWRRAWSERSSTGEWGRQSSSTAIRR